MKKLLFTLALCFAASHADAQHAYVVEGVASPQTKQVYVFKLEQRRAKPDTLNVVDGKFTLKGENADVRFVRICSDVAPTDGMNVMLDGTVKLDLANYTMSGSEENVRLAEWWNKVRVVQTKIMQLSKEMRDMQQQHADSGKGQLPEAVIAEFYNKYYAYAGEISEIAKKCCAENLNYYFPAAILSDAQLENKDWVAVADAKARCLETPLLSPYVRSIEGWRRQAVGAQFTDFEMADTTGTMRKLSEFVGSGKYVLVDFWASWCGPCRQEMPAVKALYEKYHDKGFDIVGVSFDNKRDAWLKSINSLGLPWHHISDLKGWQCAAGGIYGINSIPATLLIGPDGKIVAAGLRAEALAKKLAEIYGE